MFPVCIVDRIPNIPNVEELVMSCEVGPFTVRFQLTPTEPSLAAAVTFEATRRVGMHTVVFAFSRVCTT
jgi:hypothetical protein